VSAVVPVFHPRREARRAVRRGYPRSGGAGTVRLCRTLDGVERLLGSRLVDAVVLDVKAAPEATLGLAARFRRIPVHAFSAFRSDDGRLLAACHAAGVAGILVEGVDNAVVGEWVAGRTAQRARRQALHDAPRLLRLTERLQLAAWEAALASLGGGAPLRTADLARLLRVSREHLSREFGAGGAPNLKRVLDLVRVACAADLLANPGYTVRAVVRILDYASPGHLAAAARRVGGVTAAGLRTLGVRGVLGRFVRGRTRSRLDGPPSVAVPRPM
jgi:AraC-like DNA-binding protein